MTTVKQLVQQLRNPRRPGSPLEPSREEVEKKFQTLKVSLRKSFKPQWKSKGRDSQWAGSLIKGKRWKSSKIGSSTTGKYRGCLSPSDLTAIRKVWPHWSRLPGNENFRDEQIVQPLWLQRQGGPSPVPLRERSAQDRENQVSHSLTAFPTGEYSQDQLFWFKKGQARPVPLTVFLQCQKFYLIIVFFIINPWLQKKEVIQDHILIDCGCLWDEKDKFHPKREKEEKIELRKWELWRQRIYLEGAFKT